jgi:ribosomal protein S18 acetylase RimI-like enzyme
MTVTFRAALSRDAERVVVLMRDYYGEDGYPFDARAARSAVDGLLARPELGQLWCVEAGGQIVGYFALTLGYSFEYRGVDAFLDELYLAPAYRGQGIGTKALVCLEDRARALGVRALHLEVEKVKAAAIGLYRRWGFTEHDRFLMTKRL